MERLRETGKTFLIYMAGLFVLGVAAALFSLVLPGTIVDRLLGKSEKVIEVSTIDAPSFYEEIEVMGDDYLNHPLIVDFYARIADIEYYELTAGVQYGDMIFIELVLPNLCYEVYAYKYTTSGWTFVGTEREYCSPA